MFPPIVCFHLITKILDLVPPRSSEIVDAHSLAGRAVPVDYWWDADDKPVLVIQGLDEVIATPENGRVLRKLNEDRVVLIELNNAGHLLQYEKPREIVNHITHYLDSHKSSNR
jgi:pimeloyl-ACP methyl ester carboxylesterase